MSQRLDFSVRLRPEIIELAQVGGNPSQFVEKSIEILQAISKHGPESQKAKDLLLLWERLCEPCVELKA